MNGQERTLAAVVEGGWLLTFYCAGCRKPLVTYDSEGLLKRFGVAIRATEAEVCSRIRCEACGHRGAWTNTVAGDNTCEGFDRADGLTLWQQRDLRLRRLLHEHGLALEIADEQWSESERKECGHNTGQPRAPATETHPLSAAATLAVTRRR